MGCAHEARVALRLPLQSIWTPMYQKDQADACAAVNDRHTWESAWEAGRRMSVDRGVEVALAWRLLSPSTGGQKV